MTFFKVYWNRQVSDIKEGVTGLSIVIANGKSETAEIDTLLMSCRIIGRNIEYAFINYIIGKLKTKKISHLTAKYIKTQKNEQVKEFFDRCSFDLINENESIKNYILDINSYKIKRLDYIEVINEQ